MKITAEKVGELIVIVVTDDEHVVTIPIELGPATQLCTGILQMITLGEDRLSALDVAGGIDQ